MGPCLEYMRSSEEAIVYTGECVEQKDIVREMSESHHFWLCTLGLDLGIESHW